MSRIVLSVALCLVAPAIGPAFGQDAGAGNVVIKGPGSRLPSAAHAHYEPMIGSWDMHWKLLGPDGSVSRELSGTSEHEWVVGGRWMRATFETDMRLPGGEGDDGGEVFGGVGYFGHDNTTGEYHNVWFENNRTAVQYDKGTYTPETKTFEFVGEQPRADGTRFTTRTTVRIDSRDKHTIELFAPGQDGEERKALVLVFTRKQGEAEVDAEEVDSLENVR